LRLACANSWRDPVSKITIAKWMGDVAEAVEYKHETLSSNPSITKNKK
jgi:hypothetical protein